MSVTRANDVLRDVIQPLSGAADDYDALIHAIGDAHFVLIGAGSHGTHEFYRERARITRRLIEELGFEAVAIEADWPDAFRVNRYVHAEGDDVTAEESLRDFARFPQWVWRNADMVDFAAWLRAYNDALPPHATKVALYGLDLYCTNAAMGGIVDDRVLVDPEGARITRKRYECFDHFGCESQNGERSEEELVRQLVEQRRNAAAHAVRDDSIPPDEWFYALENARMVLDAENYYRALFGGRVNRWNIREEHMAETLIALERHLRRAARRPRLVVWTDNAHAGDARATDRADVGEWSAGQLARVKYGTDAFLIGFSTYTGTVTAASAWDGPAERKLVRPALTDSTESLLYQIDSPAFYLTFRDETGVDELRERRLQRVIGVVYKPESERRSHYFRARLPEQFDAFIHLDVTRAVEPLEKTPLWTRGELS